MSSVSAVVGFCRGCNRWRFCWLCWWVGCVGGLVVTGGAFVGGFWAQMRCFALSVVSAVSCGRVRVLAVASPVSCGCARAVSVVPVVSCGRVRVLAVVPVVSRGFGCVLAVASPVSCGAERALAVVLAVSRGRAQAVSGRLRFRSGLCVGRLVVTGGAFVGCVGGMVVLVGWL